MKVLVLGGYGAVGRHAVEQLRANGDEAYAAGRDPARADRVVDLRAPGLEAYKEALAGVDAVVNAAGAEDPHVVRETAAAGIPFVDVTATTGYVAALEAHGGYPAPVLLSVGLAPGLTTLLATAAHADAPGEPVDIGLVLGAGEKHGPAATDWSYALLGRRFADTHGGPPVRNYTAPRAFDIPGLGRRRLYRADFSDQHTLTEHLGTPVRTYFAMDSRAATLGLATLTRLPGGSRAPRGLHLPGTDRWWALARRADAPSARTWWARGRSQSRATALLAVLAARHAQSLPGGVHHLHEVLTLTDAEAAGVEVHVP